MLKRIALTAAVIATLALSLVSTAFAGRGEPSANSSRADTLRGARCVVAGVRFLVENNLLVAAAKQQVDYDTIDSDSGGSEGLINTDLPTPSFLPLGTVIRLHFTNPELFDWCN